MSTKDVIEKSDGVLRDTLKEHRGSYFVEYRPADATLPFACIQLTFLENCPETAVRHSMELELEHWLKRFPVPVMVSAFDVKGDLLHLAEGSGESHLMGYGDPLTGKIVRRWGLLKQHELPANQATVEYLARIYKGVPYRLQREIREKAEREALMTGRVIRLIVFLMVGVPVLIEMVSLGVTWIGHLLSGISIIAGFHKLAIAMGWLKPSKRKQEEAEKKRKMEHYSYHCELNPSAFEKLKFENFEREAVQQTRKEAEALRNTAQSGKSGR